MKLIEFLKFILYLIVLVVVLVIVRTYVFSPVIVKGDSMDPTLENNERVIALKFGEIQRFDIVTFPAPTEADTNYIKRVIGLPGDTVSMSGDVLHINGEAIDEPYLDEYKSELSEGEVLTWDFTFETLAQGYHGNPPVSQFTGVTTVPEGKLFVLGDNRRISKDSRIIGFIDEDQIIGNVKYVFWPFDRFGSI
ncbi:signal peptidase I [Enterococcus sp. LJL90]